MKNSFRNITQKQIIIAGLVLLALIQAGVILKLWLDKDHKTYEVNLVKINTEKDSVDYARMRYNLQQVDETVHDINSFLNSKSVSNVKLEMLDQDSLASAVYLAKQSNRYSQYLVDLEQRLQQVPVGMPTDGYVSSSFGNRKNPIPYRTVFASVISPAKTTAKSAPVPVAAPVAAAPAAPKKRKVISATIVEEKDSTGKVVKKVIPVYAPEEPTPAAPIAAAPKAAPSISSGSPVPSAKIQQKVIKEENNPPAEADQMQFHKGIDIAVAYGSDVRCTAQGTVIFAGAKGGYGNCVIISHGNGLATLYAHLSDILVKTNQVVKVNQVIAKSGNSGRSTGPHLHYEVHRNNQPVNPKLFLNF